MSDRYVLNVNADMDVLHRNPREECNLDDADDVQEVDAATAAAMLVRNTAAPCEHCGYHTEGNP